MSFPVVDDFNRGGVGDPIGSNYSIALGPGDNFRIFSGAVYCDFSGSIEALTYWNADAPAPNQRTSLTRTGAGNGFIGPDVRVSIGLGYGLWFEGSGLVSKWTGAPSRTDIGTSAPIGVGDRGTIAIIDTGIEVFRNGISTGTFTDATIASGGFGMHGFVDSGTTADDLLGEEIVTAPIPGHHYYVNQAVKRAAFW